MASPPESSNTGAFLRLEPSDAIFQSDTRAGVPAPHQAEKTNQANRLPARLHAATRSGFDGPTMVRTHRMGAPADAALSLC